jgi:hypothetical protein
MSTNQPLLDLYARAFDRCANDDSRAKLRELYTAFTQAVFDDRGRLPMHELDGHIVMAGYEKEKKGALTVRRFPHMRYAEVLMKKGIYSGPHIVYEHRDDPELGRGTLETLAADGADKVVDPKSETRLIVLRPGTI